MGPLVSADQRETAASGVEIGAKEGASPLRRPRADRGRDARWLFHEPTIFADVSPQMRIAGGRSSRLVSASCGCQSVEEGSPSPTAQYGLSASIYTQDVNRAFSAMRDVDTGIFYVNAPTIGAEVHLPFGGTKATGNGHREAGTAALEVFSEWKSVYVDFSGKLQRAQIDTAEL
jgi:aldehyde dehydrogenase (NAD+)